ncbi:NAD(P)-dependent dehydrogenase (short-subunit alcohol dehydrogenase family) [Azospirillum agricola]|uniref:SDR family NAD(P)-dependent oxidoreductase n=1 Tax=Azospirillum agricola TaxID=1720247 RepID=UPI001AE2677D|nr:SDR family oxidoreductase [Azospirillum agricola]MBP2232577.1 NAD(P)-dependent dehydrogenase (short-subunit alcohol dehydrogenase family) [Azospirillum agricola]
MNADWLGLAGKAAVVTGGGGGIGRAVALALAGAGARVAILDRDGPQAAETVRLVRERDGTALALACDVTDPDAVTDAARRSRDAVGACDVLVNNAALLRPGPLRSLELAEWNALLSVNLTGYFLCSQAFGAQMLEAAGGSIVHVASIAASHAQAFSGAYSAGKAGVVMLSRQIAVEWGPSGVRSNVVSPGLVMTPMSRGFYEAPGILERRGAVVPSRRIGRPDDMADAVAFLASPRAGYVNGEEILVDGGFGRSLMSLIPRPGFEGADEGPDVREAGSES